MTRWWHDDPRPDPAQLEHEAALAIAQASHPMSDFREHRNVLLSFNIRLTEKQLRMAAHKAARMRRGAR